MYTRNTAMHTHLVLLRPHMIWCHPAICTLSTTLYAHVVLPRVVLASSLCEHLVPPCVHTWYYLVWYWLIHYMHTWYNLVCTLSTTSYGIGLFIMWTLRATLYAHLVLQHMVLINSSCTHLAQPCMRTTSYGVEQLIICTLSTTLYAHLVLHRMVLVNSLCGHLVQPCMQT